MGKMTYTPTGGEVEVPDEEMEAYEKRGDFKKKAEEKKAERKPAEKKPTEEK